VIVPIWKNDDEKARLTAAALKVKAELAEWTGRGATDRLRVHVDLRDGMRSGAKYYEWELRGIPLRFELGPKDLEKQAVFAARRDTREKQSLPMDGLPAAAAALLERIQNDMFQAALDRREANSVRGKISYDEFKELMDGKGGFVFAGWCGDAVCEAKVKEETKATIRCMPDEEFRSAEAPASCLCCGRPSKAEAVWARAY
jgi:prolyl-tRNA synthetase